MEVQGSLMMAFFLMVVISLHFIHPEATTIDLPSARNRQSESALNITSLRTLFVGIETNNNDQLTSNINQNTKNQLQKSSNDCEANKGKCMKKKDKGECFGIINKKFECSTKKEICCEEGALQSQIDNLETMLNNLEMEQNATFDLIVKLLAKDPTTKTSTPEVTTTKTSTPEVTTTPISTCEDLGGVKIGQQCFKFHNDEKLSWDDAKAACESSGSHLASLEDPGAVLVHKNEIYGDAGWDAQFWVGGSDALNDGSWVWLNGKPFDHSFPWGTNEPNGGGSENCLMTWFNNGYNDLGCHGTLRFICELGGSK